MSAPLKKVEKQMDRVKKATDTYRDATGRLRDANGKFVSSGEKTRKKLLDIDNAAQKAGKSLGNLAKTGASAFGKLAKYGSLAVVGAAAYAGYSSVKKAMSFEAQMSTIQALTGATDAEMAKMQTLALKMGANTKYSALEAAQGIEELLKAGLTPARVQAGGLEAALNLATAGGLGLADAAEIMSTALNAYKKDGMSAADAANILAGTANASATSVEELRYSLSMVSAVAAGLGVNFEDTNIALGLFANNGLKGSDAGTSLKTMLQNLQPTTKSQIEQFTELGLVTKKGANQFFDAKGNIKSLEQISELLRKSLGKLTNQQRMLALETMFGTDAIRAANILYEEGADGVKEFRKEMSKVTALDVARKKMDNAAGAVEQFRGAIETLQISALLPTMPLIKDFANAAADFVEKYTPQITAAIQQAVTKVRNYISKNFTNNPEFQKLTTLKAKIEFIFDKFKESFDRWYSAGGKQQIEAAGKAVTDFVLNTLDAQGSRIASTMASIGKDAISSFFKGMADAWTLNQADNPLDKWLSEAWNGVFGYDIWGKNTGVTYDKDGNPVKYVENKGVDYKPSNDAVDRTVKQFTNPLAPVPSKPPSKNPFPQPLYKTPKGHAGGLDRVPYNGYTARLHRDEMVLTRTEAQNYRNSGGSSGNSARPVVINVNGVTIREEADIDRLAEKLAHAIAQ